MKLTDEPLNDVESAGGSFESKTAKIDSANLGHVFRMVSENLYSNPIGSIVREITSNCFDAHVAAGVEDAVRIKIYQDDSYFIEFQDFGVGLSENEMDTVFNSWFTSTKRHTDDFIGGWGIGSKSPLSYTDSYFIITTKDGVEYTYMYSKGEKLPELDLISKKETSNRNGTIIRIPIASYYDVSKFKTEILKQLQYFDNVYYEGYILSEYNNYNIIEGKTFKYSTLSNNDINNIHIVLGKVTYNINVESLLTELERDSNRTYLPFNDKVSLRDILNYNLPIGVKFEIGELKVTPSREDIQYNEESANLIYNRINSVIEELYEIYNRNKELRFTDDIAEFHQLRKERFPITLLKTEELFINLKVPVTYNTRSPDKYNLFGKPLLGYIYRPYHDLGINPTNYGLEMFYIKGIIREGKIKKEHHLNNEKLHSAIGHIYNEGTRNYNNNIYEINSLFNHLNNYYRTKDFKYNYITGMYLNRANVIALRPLKRTSMSYLRDILGIDKHELGIAKKVKEARKQIIRDIVKYTKSYDDLIIPSDFIEANKIKRSVTQLEEGYINCYIYGGGNVNSGNSKLDINRVLRKGSLVVYSEKEQNDLIGKAIYIGNKFIGSNANDYFERDCIKNRKYRHFSNTYSSYQSDVNRSARINITFIKVAKSTYNKLITLNYPNIISIDKFMKESKYIKRMVNSYYIEKHLDTDIFIGGNSDVRRLINILLHPSLTKKIKDLSKYKYNYYNSSFSGSEEREIEEEIFNELSHKYLDKYVVELVDDLKKLSKSLKILHYLDLDKIKSSGRRYSTNINYEVIDLLSTYFKSLSVKLKPVYYIGENSEQKSWLNYNKEVYESYS